MRRGEWKETHIKGLSDGNHMTLEMWTGKWDKETGNPPIKGHCNI